MCFFLLHIVGSDVLCLNLNMFENLRMCEFPITCTSNFILFQFQYKCGANWSLPWLGDCLAGILGNMKLCCKENILTMSVLARVLCVPVENLICLFILTILKVRYHHFHLFRTFTFISINLCFIYFYTVTKDINTMAICH